MLRIMGRREEENKGSSWFCREITELEIGGQKVVICWEIVTVV